MKRFNFRLQKVMELRQWNEKLTQQRMAEAKRRHEEARRVLEAAQTAVNSHESELAGRMNGDFAAGEAVAQLAYAGKLRGDVRENTEQLQEREVTLTQRRGELLEASRDRKAIEKLRDRRFIEHQNTVQRLEQAVLDEIGGQRHLKTKSDRQGNGRP